MKKMTSRRNFIYRLSSLVTLFLGGEWLLTSCNSKKSKGKETVADDKDMPEKLSSCNDFSEVSVSERKKRERLGYVEESPLAESYCGNCSLYLPEAIEGEGACGGCMLFKGPVAAEGYCTYWAPIG